MWLDDQPCSTERASRGGTAPVDGSLREPSRSGEGGGTSHRSKPWGRSPPYSPEMGPPLLIPTSTTPLNPRACQRAAETRPRHASRCSNGGSITSQTFPAATTPPSKHDRATAPPTHVRRHPTWRTLARTAETPSSTSPHANGQIPRAHLPHAQSALSHSIVQAAPRAATPRTRHVAPIRSVPRLGTTPRRVLEAATLRLSHKLSGAA